VAGEYVKDIKQHLTENQVVKVKIMSMDGSKISLSIKKALERKPAPRTSRPGDYEWGRGGNEKASFEDQLAKFMKDSDEKMHDLKKSFENKRGSGGYRKSAQYY
jgi:S1 RNA binding domain protein